jgi:hypothetical protein
MDKARGPIDEGAPLAFEGVDPTVAALQAPRGLGVARSATGHVGAAAPSALIRAPEISESDLREITPGRGAPRPA